MPVSDYTDEQLKAVTPEQLSTISIKPAAQSKSFTLRDPRNPGLVSTINQERTSINPALQKLRSTGLGMVGTSLENLRADRTKTIGDPSTFVQRRTDPLRQDLSRQGEAVTKRLGQTGVTGEFGRQTQESFQNQAQQKLAQGEQLAFDELASFQGNFDKVEGGLSRLAENVDFAKFTQEAQGRGMSQDLKNQLTRLEQGRIGQQQMDDAQKKQEMGMWVQLVSQLFS